MPTSAHEPAGAYESTCVVTDAELALLFFSVTSLRRGHDNREANLLVLSLDRQGREQCEL